MISPNNGWFVSGWLYELNVSSLPLVKHQFPPKVHHSVLHLLQQWSTSMCKFTSSLVDCMDWRLVGFEHFRSLQGRLSTHLDPSLMHLQLVYLPLALHWQHKGRVLFVEYREKRAIVKESIEEFDRLLSYWVSEQRIWKNRNEDYKVLYFISKRVCQPLRSWLHCSVVGSSFATFNIFWNLSALQSIGTMKQTVPSLHREDYCILWYIQKQWSHMLHFS